MAARCIRRPRSRSHGPAAENGAAAVEFALVLPLLLMLVFGIIQYGIYFFSMQSGSGAAREAARRVAVGACQTPGELTSYVTARLSGTPASNITPSATYYDESNNVIAAPGKVGGEALIRVQFDALNLHLPLIPVPNGGAVIKEVRTQVEDTSAAGSPCT